MAESIAVVRAVPTLRERMRGYLALPSVRSASTTQPMMRVAPALPATPVVTLKREPVRLAARRYAAAQQSRLTADWFAGSTSYDAELLTSLRTLRNRSRQLCRDNSYARNARRIVRNNVVGTGVGFRAQVRKRTKALHADANTQIEDAFLAWQKADRCHVAGKLSFAAIQRQIMAGVFESGEILVRLVRQRFGSSAVPLALEIIESDQLAEDYSGRCSESGNEIRMGVEVDQWQRPVAYWLYPKHPGDYSFMPARLDPTRLTRVPAGEIIHLFVADEERPGATRGAPWLSTAAKKLNDIDATVEAEIVRARAAACFMGFVTRAPGEGDPTVAAADAMGSDDVEDGQKVYDFEPGLIKELDEGQDYKESERSAPNPALETFLTFLVRYVCSGVGVSEQSLTRNYANVNYSSGRLALLDDRDNWRVLQQWFCEHFLQRVYEAWLDMAVLSGVLAFPDYESNVDRYHQVAWLPRGWAWVDPQKDVAAAKEAIKAGLSTRQDELAFVGKDSEDIDDQRRRELAYQQGNGDDTKPEDIELVYDVDPGAPFPGEKEDPAVEGDTGIAGAAADAGAAASGTPASPAKPAPAAPPAAAEKAAELNAESIGRIAAQAAAAALAALNLPEILRAASAGRAVKFQTNEAGDLVGAITE